MNYIDNDFYKLFKLIKSMDKNELFLNIKNHFNNIPNTTRESIINFLNKFKFWGILNPSEGNFEEIENRTEALFEHIDDFYWLYNKLEDFYSKEILLGIISNWFYYDFEILNKVIDKRFYPYFDLDIIPNCKDECIVDLGVYTGDTILDYINTYGKDSYSHIYCYDITDESMVFAKNNLKNYDNISFRKKAVSDTNDTLFLNMYSDISSNRVSNSGDAKIESVTLDNDITDKITMIKMDIEGSEYNALLGTKNHIINENPKLLISVYHGYKDLYRIPKLIYNLNKNYKFYLRYYGGSIFPTEITLIAICDDELL